MTKTTVLIDDDVYKKLVKESVETYGTTKGISRVINKKLKESLAERGVGNKKNEEVVEKTFGIWKMKESGKVYVRRLRDESEKRRSKLGI